MATKKTPARKKAPAAKPTPAKSDIILTEGPEESLDEAVEGLPVTRNISPEFAKYDVAKRVAHTLALSSLVPDAYRGRPNDVFVAINMGAELGMEPFQAIQSIAVIDGKPCLYGDGLIGVVRASPKCLWIEESLNEDETIATCKTQRKGDPNPTVRSYSMGDAVKAGIDTKFNWKKHPKRMLQMRARAYCLRDAYPDLLKGLGVVEEVMDHDDSPPPVTSYDLPEKATPLDTLTETFGEGVRQGATIAQVREAMNKAQDMAQLLKAGEMAKDLTPEEQATVRQLYKDTRKLLMEGE